MEEERVVRNDVMEQLESDVANATARADEMTTQLNECKALLADAEARANAEGQSILFVSFSFTNQTCCFSAVILFVRVWILITLVVQIPALRVAKRVVLSLLCANL